MNNLVDWYINEYSGIDEAALDIAIGFLYKKIGNDCTVVIITYLNFQTEFEILNDRYKYLRGYQRSSVDRAIYRHIKQVAACWNMYCAAGRLRFTDMIPMSRYGRYLYIVKDTDIPNFLEWRRFIKLILLTRCYIVEYKKHHIIVQY